VSPTALVDQTVVTVRDGTKLATEVWLPGNGGPRPVMLVRTPYGLAAARAAHDALGLVQSGWAVVLQDVRGRYGSEGTFEPFHQEILDGRDTIGWCAAQPWSDGRVVTTGASYLGATQWLAASTSPPALKAFSPMITAPSAHEGWSYENGAFHHAFMTQWALDMAGTAPRLGARQARRIEKLRARLVDLGRGAPAENGVADVFPAYGRFADYHDRSYWRAIDVRRRMPRLDIAGYHVGGWYDIFCEGTIAGYNGMRSSAATEYARTSQRLVIGPWVHAGVFGTATGAWDFGPTANGFARGFPQEMHTFLTGALDRREVPTGVTVYVMGADRWIDLPDWPPPAQGESLYLDATVGAQSLAGDGRLEAQPAPTSGVDRYRHDPKDPVPNHGGRTLGAATPLGGPADQRAVEQRDDVLVYTGEPLRSELWIVGEVRAAIWFSTTAAEADVTVKLLDVHPDGLAFNIVDGASRVSRKTSSVGCVELSVGSTAYCFKPGHRIRVEVASADFPRLSLAPAGDQGVRRGGRTPSSVTLPVVPRP
jgi:putative CocE/NonD family hydrolase